MRWLQLIILLTALTTAARAQQPAEAAAPPDGPRQGTVSATSLNVRARAGRQYEVVCQLSHGAAVEVVRDQGDWLGIRAPAESVAWLAADAVVDGVVTADKATIHAGPAPVFTAFGTFRKGEKVSVIRTRGKWLQVKPPAESLAWVHAVYIQQAEPEPPPEDDATAAADAPPDQGDDAGPEKPGDEAAADPGDAVATEPDPGVPGASEPLEPPADVKIHRIKVKPPPELIYASPAKPVHREGMVIPVGEEESHWAYGLAVKAHDTYYPLAYLKWKSGDLKAWKWRRVRITGQQRWVKGWPRPLVQVETLEKAAE